MHLGPEDVLLALEIELRAGLSAAEAPIDRLDRAIRADHPGVKHLFIEAQSIREAKDAHGRAPAEQGPPAV